MPTSPKFSRQAKSAYAVFQEVVFLRKRLERLEVDKANLKHQIEKWRHQSENSNKNADEE